MALRETLELDLNQAQAAIDKLEKSIDGIASTKVAVDIDTRSVAELDRRLDDIEQSANEISDETRRMAAEAGKADANFEDLARALDISEDEARAMTAQILKASSAADRTERAARDIADELGLSKKEAAAFARQVDKASGKVGDVDKTVGKTTTGIGKMTTAMKGFVTVAAVAVAGRALVGFGASAVSAAADMEESVSKARVVFGEFADEVLEFTSTAPEDLRLSTREATEMVGTFGNLFVALGLSQGAAADLSQEVLDLGADLGSFNNIEVGEVLEKLRSGLVGEAEPLRALGVNIDEATTKAKALELGLGGITGELTAGEKVQARWALVLEQTVTAQGDAARTADTLVGSLATLQGKWQDLKAEIGQELIPVINDSLLPILENLIDSLGPKLVDAAGRAAIALGRIVGIFDPLVREQTAALVVFRDIEQSMGSGFGAMTKFRTAVEELTRSGRLSNETFEDARKFFGVSLEDALTGTEIAMRNLGDETSVTDDQMRDLKNKGSQQLQQAVEGLGPSLDRLTQIEKALGIELRETTIAAALADETIRRMASGVHELGEAFTDQPLLTQSEAMDILADAAENLGIPISELAANVPDDAADLMAALETISPENLELLELNEQMEEFVDGFNTSTQNLARGVDVFGKVPAKLKTSKKQFIDNLKVTAQEQAAFEANVAQLAIVAPALAETFRDQGIETRGLVEEFLADSFAAENAEAVLSGAAEDLTGTYTDQLASAIFTSDLDAVGLEALQQFLEGFDSPEVISAAMNAILAKIAAELGQPFVTPTAASAQQIAVAGGLGGGLGNTYNSIDIDINHPPSTDLPTDITRLEQVIHAIEGLVPG